MTKSTLTSSDTAELAENRLGLRTHWSRIRTGAVAATVCLLMVGCGSSTEGSDSQGDDGEPRLNQIVALGRSNSPVPAGRWGAEIDGINVEVRSEQSLDSVSFNYDDSGRPPEALIFDPIPADEWGGFFVVPFEGFIDGVGMRIPTGNDPLTADEFIDGLSQAVEVENVTESSIGGQPSVTWEFGPLDPNSAFACGSDNRSDLDDGDLCTNWGAAGERFVEPESESLAWNFHYVESAGMLVAWVHIDSGDADPFAELADALVIEP